ncbi:MAG: hypothetical protein K2X82_12805 [Gemmataceae bacterium]|nr:hypothetical protein [Gemmataceae bacterium]
MRTRITAGLAAVLAGVGLAAGQPKPADPGPAPKFLYGHDLKVRPGGEKDFPKAAKVGVEVYGHEVADGDARRAFAVVVTEAGGLAVFPAGPVGSDKRCQWQTAHDLRVRKAGETEFTQKTKPWGVEVFRDLASNRLLYVTEAGAVASAPAGGAGGTGTRLQYGANLKVRGPDEQTFEKAKRFGAEVFRDESTGGLLYLTEAGAIAAAPAPAAAIDPKKVADPRSAYGLVLRVRGADEPGFTDATKRVGVEVYEDPNAGTLVYVTEAGAVAAAPAGKLADAKGVTWLGGMNLPARKGGEKEFDKAKKYAVEVFRDNRTGNLLFVSETGAIAVLAK